MMTGDPLSFLFDLVVLVVLAIVLTKNTRRL